jgi:glucose/arabinose dehydrogenase
LVATAVVPDYALGAHVAALGLAAVPAGPLTAAMTAARAALSATAATPQQGMFVGLHGSWNRRPHAGYKVIYVAFDGGKPVGLPHDVLTGFVNADGKAFGRPVGVAIDARGALLVADDVGNTVWRVTPMAPR